MVWACTVSCRRSACEPRPAPCALRGISCSLTSGPKRALCVLNDAYREAERLGIAVAGVAVEADGGFDDEWRSTGMEYSITLDSAAPTPSVEHLLAVVDEVAEVPRTIRVGAPVHRRR